jgi:hypothetical protein
VQVIGRPRRNYNEAVKVHVVNGKVIVDVDDRVWILSTSAY